MTHGSDVLARRDGRVGRIRLDRPNALNALTQPMIRAFRAALEAWRDAPEVHAVVVESSSDRAFCAGGDVRAVRTHVLRGEDEPVAAFFREEYDLNLAIATYPKPIVALIDGICMGGGVGLSVHGTYRVATERAVIAMPETAIGLFPDIGATYILPRLPGRIGRYLGLTGARMRGGDTVHAGLATHFVPHAALAALSEALAKEGVAVLARHAVTAPAFSLAEYGTAIDRCFDADNTGEILRRLEDERAPWAEDALTAMREASPSALVWTLAILRAGAHSTLPQCLQRELRLVLHAVRCPDFAEGVRAMVIDKDKRPRWSPERVEDVDAAAIATILG
jgi:enoyl-CoA hydratase